MNDFHYQELERLISEYEEDTKLIKSDRLIIKNYPKVFTMSVVSSFEYYLKDYLNEFIAFPSNSISTTYPFIDALLRKNPGKPIVDKMYAKLESYEKEGIEVLDATKFYDLFNGDVFKNEVKNNFFIEQQTQIVKVSDMIDRLSALIGTDDRYDNDYAKYTDIKERLDLCTFDKAENAFLSLKLRRNRVAHNYLNGLADSFEDLRNFYYDAVLFVISLETALESLIDSST